MICHKILHMWVSVYYEIVSVLMLAKKPKIRSVTFYDICMYALACFDDDCSVLCRLWIFLRCVLLYLP